jgi:hypothetical protein
MRFRCSNRVGSGYHFPMISAGSVRSTAAAVNQESGLHEIFFLFVIFLLHSGSGDGLAANLG